MDRLIAANSVNLSGADGPPASGTPQYATDGNPALSIPATRWPAYQYNAIQEELIGVIVAAGLTPSKSNTAQLLAALTGGKLGRTRLTANTTINVGGGGDPYATMNAAIAAVQKNYDLNAFVLTLKWNAAGNNTENVSILGIIPGQNDPGNFVLDFNNKTQTVSSGNNITADNAAQCKIQNFTLTNTGSGSGILSNNRSHLLIGSGAIFGAFGSAGSHMIAELSGQITVTTSYSITGGGGTHANANTLGQLNLIGGITATLTGTPAFANVFLSLTTSGFFGATSVTFTGAATGVRYGVVLNAVAFTGGLTLPGNSAGSTSTGGQYN